MTIGSGNVFREFVTVHQGHYDTTVIGSACYFMNKVYIGHDGRVGDGITMASSATLGGHVHVGDGANIGMNTVVHQRRVIGPGAMVGMGSVVTRDVPPFAKAYGNPCRVRGVNAVGMAVAGCRRRPSTSSPPPMVAGALPARSGARGPAACVGVVAGDAGAER